MIMTRHYISRLSSLCRSNPILETKTFVRFPQEKPDESPYRPAEKEEIGKLFRNVLFHVKTLQTTTKNSPPTTPPAVSTDRQTEGRHARADSESQPIPSSAVEIGNNPKGYKKNGNASTVFFSFLAPTHKLVTPGVNDAVDYLFFSFPGRIYVK